MADDRCAGQQQSTMTGVVDKLSESVTEIETSKKMEADTDLLVRVKEEPLEETPEKMDPQVDVMNTTEDARRFWNEEIEFLNVTRSSDDQYPVASELASQPSLQTITDAVGAFLTDLRAAGRLLSPEFISHFVTLFHGFVNLWRKDADYKPFMKIELEDDESSSLMNFSSQSDSLSNDSSAKKMRPIRPFATRRGPYVPSGRGKLKARPLISTKQVKILPKNSDVPLEVVQPIRRHSGDRLPTELESRDRTDPSRFLTKSPADRKSPNGINWISSAQPLMQKAVSKNVSIAPRPDGGEPRPLHLLAPKSTPAIQMLNTSGAVTSSSASVFLIGMPPASVPSAHSSIQSTFQGFRMPRPIRTTALPSRPLSMLVQPQMPLRNTRITTLKSPVAQPRKLARIMPGPKPPARPLRSAGELSPTSTTTLSAVVSSSTSPRVVNSMSSMDEAPSRPIDANGSRAVLQSDLSLIFSTRDWSADSRANLYSEFEAELSPLKPPYTCARRIKVDKADDPGEMCDIATHRVIGEFSLNKILETFGGLKGVDLDDVVISFGQQENGNLGVNCTAKFRKTMP